MVVYRGKTMRTVSLSTRLWTYLCVHRRSSPYFCLEGKFSHLPKLYRHNILSKTLNTSFFLLISLKNLYCCSINSPKLIICLHPAISAQLFLSLPGQVESEGAVEKKGRHVSGRRGRAGRWGWLLIPVWKWVNSSRGDLGSTAKTCLPTTDHFFICSFSSSA